jgi:hypothetical protein
MPNEPDDRDSPPPEHPGPVDEGAEIPPEHGPGGEHEPPLERTLRERLQVLIPELVRKTFHAGLGAVLSTEEGIRKIAPDFTLPKDVANYVLASADGAKDEVMRVVGRELHEFLGRLNVSQELAKLLTQLSFEIKTEVRFIPNDQAVSGVKPDVKNKVALKRTRPTVPIDKDEAGADDDE